MGPHVEGIVAFHKMCQVDLEISIRKKEKKKMGARREKIKKKGRKKEESKKVT